LVALAIGLAGAPAASAAPPNVYPNVGTHASQTPIDVSFVTNEPLTIRYTTNGPTPTASSPQYTGTPLHFVTTTVLKWIATNAGGETASGEETYTVDTNPPTVTIMSPAAGASFVQFSQQTANYSCADAEINWTSCTGSSAYGAPIDTSTAGSHLFTVVAYDSAGNRTERSAPYVVTPATQTGGGVSGTVPPTLNLTLGTAPALGPFTAGTAKDYTSSTTATVTSSAGEATLSVADPSSFQTGHLVNGTFFLPQALQAGVGGAFAPIGGSSAPTTLKTYSGPVSMDVTTLNFKQSIGANDALRTGSYTKTLTFTLSTATP
jgi:hypothetical protein